MRTTTRKAIRSGTLILLLCALPCTLSWTQVAASPAAHPAVAQKASPQGAGLAEHGNGVVPSAAALGPGSSLSTALLSSTESVGETVHLVVGRSLYINTPTRLRRVYVSNPDVLNSFTASPNQIVVTAKAPGVSGLILWNDTGQSRAYLVSSDLDVEALRTSLVRALPGESVQVEAREGKVYLTGTVSSDEAAAAAIRLATLHSKEVANSLIVNRLHVRQVKLKVRFVEVDRVKLDEFGLNFFSGGKNMSATTTGQFPTTSAISAGGSSVGGSGSSTAGGGGTSLTLSDPLNLFFFNTSLNVGVTLRDLENKQVLQILAEPSITTLSGQKASFLSGGEFPFPVVQGGSGGFSSVTIQFRDYGVRLEFTPTVNPDGTIQLKVNPEVSALDYTNSVTISGYTIPAISTRKAETEVELRDGQSFAISGLLDHRTTQVLAKMPGIGNVPVLGEFFKSKELSHSLVELIVIVTPIIVDPLTESSSPTDPKLALPNMDEGQFDRTLGKHKPAASPK